MTMQLALIVAYSRNRVIGRDNALPWRLPSDLAHFKRTTMGKPIIMGRRTWESLGRPLPGRLNIVLTRSADYQAEGATIAASLEEAMSLCEEGDTEVAFVIGGEEIFRLALPLARRIVATEIDADIEGDTWFPALPDTWHEIERHPQLEENGLSFAFVTYERHTS